MGGARALTLISSDGIVDGRCTVLDYVPDEAGYYSGYYEASESGILCISWNSTDLSNYPVYRVVYKISAEGGSPLRDVKWVTIGDSLNDFNTTGITKNWIKYMIEGTECDNTNLAASGTGFYRGVATAEGETSNNYIAKIAAIPEDTELITIAGSFNDISSSPWETLDVGTATDTGNTTIAGYMNAFFDELLENFSEVSIGVYMTAPWSGYHYGVQRSDDYVNVLREICLRRGIPFDDSAYYGNGLKPWIEANRVRYYTRTTGTVDGVHPNNEGHKFIYRMLRPFVEKLSPKGNT
jgi:lysophospholipase L1-like esterase